MAKKNDKAQLKTAGTKEPKTDESVSVRYVVNHPNGLNLRKRPSYGAEVLEVLDNNTELNASAEGNSPNGWLSVATEAGTVGFVSDRYVKKIEE